LLDHGRAIADEKGADAGYIPLVVHPADDVSTSVAVSHRSQDTAQRAVRDMKAVLVQHAALQVQTGTAATSAVSLPDVLSHSEDHVDGDVMSVVDMKDRPCTTVSGVDDVHEALVPPLAP
jgi:hypothetical protein